MESGEELAFHIPPSLCALCLKGSRAASFCFPLCHEHNSSIHFKIYIWKKICIYCTDSPGFSSLMFACIQGFAVPSNHRCFLFCSLTCPVLGFSSGIVSFTVMCTLSRGKMPEKRFPPLFNHFLCYCHPPYNTCASWLYSGVHPPSMEHTSNSKDKMHWNVRLNFFFNLNLKFCFRKIFGFCVLRLSHIFLAKSRPKCI